jgi:hypothetical protein
MSADCFQTLDVALFQEAVARLHEVVCGGKGRIEITRPDCDEVCVLISKTELESMERALQIFAGSKDYQQMSTQIAQIVAAAGPVVPGNAAMEQ